MYVKYPKGQLIGEVGKALATNGYDIKVFNTIDTYNTGETRGREQSHSLNYSKLGKDLMSIDELAVMNGDKCILQLRSVRPFLSDKYDLTQHPNYHLTADADERNYFDVEKYLHRQLKLKKEDVFEVVDVDALENAVI